MLSLGFFLVVPVSKMIAVAVGNTIVTDSNIITVTVGSFLVVAGTNYLH